MTQPRCPGIDQDTTAGRNRSSASGRAPSTSQVGPAGWRCWRWKGQALLPGQIPDRGVLWQVQNGQPLVVARCSAQRLLPLLAWPCHQRQADGWDGWIAPFNHRPFSCVRRVATEEGDTR